jgi:lysophospholipase L1-like esterase
MRSKPAPLLANLMLAILAVGLTLAMLEVGVRAYVWVQRSMVQAIPDPAGVPLYELCDCGYLYGLNPEHPEVSAQGLRDREYAVPKTAGAQRVLVLGDSITYGTNVAAASTFSEQLERSLAGQVEVINSGVAGYTPYNELQYYREQGRLFEPDVVIVVFSLNDVANPRLHINYADEQIEAIPAAAIPNPAYDQAHILPLIEARRSTSPLDWSALYDFVTDRLEAEAGEFRSYEDPAGYTELQGRRWPTFITGEDTLSIEVLTDYQSPEWQWLRTMYGQLAEAVSQDGARLALVAVPLAYQLEDGYPYLPQTLLAQYTAEQGLPYLDLLPTLQPHAAEDLFFGTTTGTYDVWHLTDRGHTLTAEALRQFLLDEALLEGQAPT